MPMLRRRRPLLRAAAVGGGADAMDRLAQLGQLHDQGLLADDEFATQKAVLLGG